MSTSSFDDLTREDIEVRVLGPLRVRRADGTVVRPSEWPTTQTADLLRILALHVGEAVHVETLLELLWPHADEQHGRASLRTAASRVRKVVRGNCVERRLGGLALTGAWVDAQAFQGLAQQVRRRLAQGDCAGALLAAREADALYLGDLLPHHASGDWVEREREVLAATRRTLLLEAAEAAAQLAWWRDATELADRALALEPCSERAYRVLMRAQRGTGETALALKTYDRCRHALSEHVGADPSPQTQHLHRELLEQTSPAVPVPPFRGRVHELASLRAIVATSAAEGRRAVVVLEAAAGAGKTRLAQEALGPRAPRSTCSPDGDRARASVVEEEGRGAPALLLDDVHHLTAEGLRDLLHRPAVAAASCVVLAGRSLPPGASAVVADVLGARPVHFDLPPLAREEVADLCAAVLAGAVSDALVDRVVETTDGAPAAVVRTVRDWVDTGRVAATSAGLVVLDTAPDSDAWAHRLLALAVDRLSATEMELLQLIAAAGRAVTPELLLPLVDLTDQPDAAGIAEQLDRLVDLALVSHSPHGCAPRDEIFADLLLSWLRPSARRELHRRIAERARIPASERVAHWEQAGEPELARAAALEAAQEAAGREPEQARAHLRRLSAEAQVLDPERGDAVELLLGWSDAATATGRVHEAQAARTAADAVARGEGGLPASSALVTAATAGGHDDGGTRAPEPERPATDPLLAQRLREAIREADAHGCTTDRWAARMHMIREVSVPQRRLRGLRRWARQAWALSEDPVLRAEVLVHAWTPAAVLGDALRAERGLAEAAALLGPDADGEVAARVAALRSLVAHDLGRVDATELRADAERRGSLEPSAEHHWVAVRMAGESGDGPVAPLTLLPEGVRPASHPVPPPAAQMLLSCARAVVQLRAGQPEEARTDLARAVELAGRSGATLALPEALARSIAATAGQDRSAACRTFEHFEECVGSTDLPRESTLKLLARAAVRAADGRAEDAASAAAAAAETAGRAGLVHLAAEAHRDLAGHLRAAGRPAEARLAASSAKRWEQALTPAATTPAAARSVTAESARRRVPGYGPSRLRAL